MTTFQYKATDAQQSSTDGRIDAVDVKTALWELEQQGLRVTSISELSVVEAEMAMPVAHAAVAPSTETESLQRLFSAVLEKGESIAPALDAYAQELPRGKQRNQLKQLAVRLRAGNDPSNMISTDDINEQWIPFLASGVSSNDAGIVLSGIIDESQRTGELRRRFAAALAYPVFLLVVVVVLLSLFAWMVVPVFEEIFRDFGTQLPGMTMLVVNVHQIIRDTGGLALLIPAILISLALLFLSWSPSSGSHGRLYECLPIIGSGARLAACARFCRCLADLVEAKVPTIDALRISGRHTDNYSLRHQANDLAAQLESGVTSLEDARSGIPRTVLHALQLGTKPTASAQILREVSWMYDRQTETRLTWAISLIEPAFVVFLGLLVAVHFLALMMPLVSLVQNLT